MLGATLAAGWAPKLGLDLAGGLSVVYETHTPVTQAEVDTITTILNERVGGSSGATVSSQGTATCPDKVHKCALIGASVPGQKNTQQTLDRLGKTAQLFFRPALCYAPAFAVAKGQTASTGALPACSTTSQLSTTNLAVNTSTGQATGNPPPDPAFATYPSTSPLNDAKSATVLLPGLPGQGTQRYVLGPAQVTGSQIKSANASLSGPASGRSTSPSARPGPPPGTPSPSSSSTPSSASTWTAR